MIKVTRTQLADTSKGNALSFHNVVADGYVIRDITLVAGQDGEFASFPSRRWKDNEGNDRYSDFVFPESTEKRDEITAACLAARNAVLQSKNAEGGAEKATA